MATTKARTTAMPTNMLLTVWRSNLAGDPDEQLSADQFAKSWNECLYSDETRQDEWPARIPHQPYATAYNLGMHVVACMGYGFHGDEFREFITETNIPVGTLRGEDK